MLVCKFSLRITYNSNRWRQ